MRGNEKRDEKNCYSIPLFRFFKKLSRGNENISIYTLVGCLKIKIRRKHRRGMVM